MPQLRRYLVAVVLSVTAGTATVIAQQPPPSPQPPSVPTVAETVTVVETAPLPGTSLPVERVPAPVQTRTAREIEQSGAVDLSEFLATRFNAVHVNELQGNPFQPDVNYRGYTASPLLGTPQGLSVYLDGVRMNQPFGDVVSWDLIPRAALASVSLVAGANPVFGLNTLGGALSMHTKTGREYPGSSIQTVLGSANRRVFEFEHGNATASGFHWFTTGHLFSEDGWRQDSPSDVGQLFGKVGRRTARTDVDLTVTGVKTSLNGNGLQEERLLDRDYRSVYTKPDTTRNRSTLVTLGLQRRASDTLLLSGNVYVRHIRTNTLNGDINEDALDQSVYQPNAAERAALAAAGYAGVPESGETAENTPFPSWRCIANVLLNDEPGEKCTGLINRTHSRQRNGGVSGQLTKLNAGGGRHQVTLGGAYDRSHVDFSQSTELGYLGTDRGVVGLNVFADGVTGGTVDGDPYDARAALSGVIQTMGVYATDTWSVGSRWSLTFSGRFNRTRNTNRDRIRPGGGAGSLDGDHVFARFNPAVGFTVDLAPSVNAYGGYTESSRAATSIELGCADPEQPCRLPNALAGDPPLDQVVTRSADAGLRGHWRGADWGMAWFRAENRNDILFVASEQTGFGYFRNFGKTRRQGLELSLNSRIGRASLGGGYTFLDATYQSPEAVFGTGNSSNEAAATGLPGVDGLIEIEAGNRMPLMPRHVFKAYGDVVVSRRLSLDVSIVGASSAFARGNENNAHEPDGTYYLGKGLSDGYAVVDLGVRYQLTTRWQLLAQLHNVFNTHYATGAQLGPTGIRPDGTFVARPFPAINGEFPVQQSTFVAPGTPRTGSAGVRVRF